MTLWSNKHAVTVVDFDGPIILVNLSYNYTLILLVK